MPRTAAPLGPDAAPSAVPRTGALLVAGAAALSAWACWLGSSLPPSALRQSWSAAWTGLGSWQLTWVMVDSLEVLGLLVTGVALRRGHWVSAFSAAVSVPLFVLDAWFDVMTSTTRVELWQAVAMAVLVELPTAAVLARVAWWGARAVRAAMVPGDGEAPRTLTPRGLYRDQG